MNPDEETSPANKLPVEHFILYAFKELEAVSSSIRSTDLLPSMQWLTYDCDSTREYSERNVSVKVQ
jgi:hypothetical protein